MTLKMQNYMEKHKIGPLFEDLMNKVLRDMPEDPLVYVLKSVYKKAGLDIPQDIRYGGMRRSTSDLPRSRSRSPDKAFITSSAEAAVNRDYDKPWQTQGKKLKPKRSGDDSEPSRSRRHKPDWNNDVKMKSTSFDELWDDPSPVKKDDHLRRTEPVSIMRKSWARVGLDDENDITYTSSKYSGPRRARFDGDEEDLLAAENVVSSRRDLAHRAAAKKKASSKSSKLRSAAHRQELEKLLHDSDRRSVDSGYTGDGGDDVEDDALELLEDADDLRREGVTNIPASGYRLSKIMRQRREEPTVKLNINLFPRPEPSPSIQGDPYEEVGDYGDESDREYRPRAGKRGGRYQEDSDDDFESVSQVTGPRRPVWGMPDSDGESYIPRPAFTTPQPTRTRHRPPHSNRLSSTGPARYHSGGHSMDSVEDFTQEGGRTWTPGRVRTSQRVVSPDDQTEVRESLQSARGGWALPDDSDASFTDFSHRQTEPRAY